MKAAKNQCSLQAAGQAAPKAVYVNGRTQLKQDVTGSVVKDQLTGDDAFAAGAMEMADNGVCCIDAFDQILPRHHDIALAMEQRVRNSFYCTC